MKRRIPKTIVYVNYSPYENAGKILDYLLEQYSVVCLFSFSFYRLSNRTSYNTLQIYKNGSLSETYPLFQIPVIPKLIFLFLPVQSIITFLDIVFYSRMLKAKFKTLDLYFTVNAFTAWVGLLLKKMNVVKKTMFWVWDYYPLTKEKSIVMLMRRLYWQFDKVSSHSDIVVFQNKMLLDLRKRMGIYPRNSAYAIVPLGTDKIAYSYTHKKFTRNTLVFGFIGVLKKSQGIEIVFNNAAALKKVYGEVRYEIVGSGPDEEYLKLFAKRSGINATFHGYLEGETFNVVLRATDIGIATYVPDKGNVSPYGDPGKIKRYLSLGIPVITTDVHQLAGDIEKSGAGMVVEFSSSRSFMDAVKTILGKHALFSKHAYDFNQRFYYKKIYREMFRNI